MKMCLNRLSRYPLITGFIPIGISDISRGSLWSSAPPVTKKRRSDPEGGRTFFDPLQGRRAMGIIASGGIANAQPPAIFHNSFGIEIV